MIEVKVIDQTCKDDINIKNEPFSIFGRMIPAYVDEKWSFSEVMLPENEISDMCFPDENYDFDAMSKNTVFIGAYENGECIGLAIMQDYWFKYMYLYDLKVKNAYRSKGVGQALLEKAKEVARERKYRGIYTVGQDNNLAACKFYLKMGFEIGGFDNRAYRGTAQEEKADIYFYLDC